MRVDQILFTDLVYVLGTGCTQCNAGVTLCAWIREVEHEIPACVFPLMTSMAPELCYCSFFSGFHSFLVFHFVHDYAFISSPFRPWTMNFDTILMLYNWILCFVHINFFSLNFPQSE